MVVVPDDLPLPRVCPECGGYWTAHGIRADGVTISLGCTESGAWHFFDYPLSEVQAIQFQLANDADALMNREIWLDGANTPMLNMPPMPNAFAVVGEEFTLNGGRFRIVRVETDRVVVRITA